MECFVENFILGWHLAAWKEHYRLKNEKLTYYRNNKIKKL
jgi:hypothetical protein